MGWFSTAATGPSATRPHFSVTRLSVPSRFSHAVPRGGPKVDSRSDLLSFAIPRCSSFSSSRANVSLLLVGPDKDDGSKGLEILVLAPSATKAVRSDTPLAHRRLVVHRDVAELRSQLVVDFRTDLP